MRFILSFLYISWMAIVIVYQFSNYFKKKLHATKITSWGLIPSWKLFSPMPVQGDYLVCFRVYDGKNKKWARWKELPYIGEKNLWSVFLHPQANVNKSMRKLCDSLRKQPVNYNPANNMLLNFLRNTLKKGELKDYKGSIQFRIVWTTIRLSSLVYISGPHEF